MDIATIAAAALTFSLPFLKKAGEKMSEKIGENIWTRIKKVFTSDKQKKLVEKLEKNPEDVKTQGAIEAILDEKIDNDELLKKEFALLIENAKQKGQNLKLDNSKNSVENSNNNTIIQGINSGNDTNIHINDKS